MSSMPSMNRSMMPRILVAAAGDPDRSSVAEDIISGLSPFEADSPQ
jgi:hypothetical protein